MGVQMDRKCPRCPCSSPDTLICLLVPLICSSDPPLSIRLCFSLLCFLSPSACLHVCRSCPHLCLYHLSLCTCPLGSPVTSDSPPCLSHEVPNPPPPNDSTCCKSSLTGVVRHHPTHPKAGKEGLSTCPQPPDPQSISLQPWSDLH